MSAHTTKRKAPVRWNKTKKHDTTFAVRSCHDRQMSGEQVLADLWLEAMVSTQVLDQVLL